MIITLNVSIGMGIWGEDMVRKEVELRTENPVPADLPWEAICAGLVQSALAEYAENEQKKNERKSQEEKNE